MIKVEKIETWGFEHAIRGMRNPLNSWDRSDSHYCAEDCPMVENSHDPALECNDGKYGYCIGENDFTLMQKLYAAGHPHRKYLRQIFVAMDITAPLYWWKEFDTYKVGTTANSCSTMHKLTAKEFTLEDFSFEDCDKWTKDVVCSCVINALNMNRSKYLETKDKELWRQMVQLLPSSYNQRRTVTMTYENVMNILDYRQGHKLSEWNEYCKILLGLPYVADLCNATQKR